MGLFLDSGAPKAEGLGAFFNGLLNWYTANLMIVRNMAEMTTKYEMNYRPDVEGLRAVAVISVIINHFYKDILPSGYLGVDIFFVISGYVITASLIRKDYRGISTFIAEFYMRRIKRLAPALILCVLVTAILASLLDPSPGISLKTGIASLFGISNLYLYSLAIDYYAPSTEMNVFTQTWSLGVEEQFYLFFPFLVWFLYFRQKLGRNGLFGALLVLSLLSLGGFVYFSVSYQPAAYFLMPSRLWELAAGAMILLYERSNRFATLMNSLKTYSPLMFIALLTVLFAPIQHAVSATIAVVILTTLLIGVLRPESPVFTLLTVRPVIFIGAISYSLYLWHWSVLSLSRWSVGITAWTIAVQVSLMLVLAFFSFNYVEAPLRRKVWSPARWRTITYGITASLGTAALIVLVLAHQQKLHLRLEGQLSQYAAFLPLKDSRLPFNPTCVVDDAKRKLQPDTFEKCTILPNKKDGQTIWVLGDSHAGHLQGLLYALNGEVGLGVHLVETPGVPFPLPVHATFKPRDILVGQMEEKLRKGDILLIARLFLDRANLQARDLTGWIDEVVRLAEALRTKGVSLVIFGPPPMFTFDTVEKCRSYAFGNTSCDIPRESLTEGMGQIYSLLRNVEEKAANVFVYDSFSALCPKYKHRCSPSNDGKSLYRDRDHFNSFGSASLAGSFACFLREKKLLDDQESTHDCGQQANETLFNSYYQSIEYPILATNGNANMELVLGTGWHGLEERHVWSDARAKLMLPVPRSCFSGQCAVVMKFFVYGASSARPVAVKFESIENNWEKVVILTSMSSNEVLIPLSGKKGNQEVDVMVPEATSPQALSGLPDRRKLGIALQGLALKEK